MLNEAEEETPSQLTKDELTEIWRDSTLNQLNTISVTSALFGGVVASSFSWPYLGRLASSHQSTVLAVWYSALVLALTSIATSAQQAVALTRLTSHPDGLRKIRELLGRPVDGGNPKWRPSKLQLICWQAPLSLLNTSVIMFTVGLIVLVWKSVTPALTGDGIKIATLFTLTLVYCAGLYILSAHGLYYQIRDT
ncbi:hypothetical protein BDV96DRAFT_694247 [Lophiotrema nucula]|uniref:Uncharacterized protein n=1 Tax=Lophiotrema nucula TaxID=690887 RepID=A0A6A5YIV3_9PLEO|nr:hypothetical protein BDV96DRAFT_694247 [Lophiotrema nucula]